MCVYQTVHDPGDDCWQQGGDRSGNVRPPSAADVRSWCRQHSRGFPQSVPEEQGAPSAVSSKDLAPLLLLVRGLKKEEIG